MVVGPCSLYIDQSANLRIVGRSYQVAEENESAGPHDAKRFGQDAARLRDMVDDAIGNHGRERLGGIGQLLTIDPSEPNSIRESGGLHIQSPQFQHFLGQIDSDDAHLLRSPAKLDRDQRRAGAEVKNLAIIKRQSSFFGSEQKIIDKQPIDRRVVPRVVIPRFLGGIHHFRFKRAGDHEFQLLNLRGLLRFDCPIHPESACVGMDPNA